MVVRLDCGFHVVRMEMGRNESSRNFEEVVVYGRAMVLYAHNPTRAQESKKCFNKKMASFSCTIIETTYR